MALTDVGVRSAKPTGKLYRLFDERGMYLEVSATGGKWWRFKYRFEGKEKRLSLGVYPDVGLKDAREQRDEMRKLLTKGVDPGEHKKAKKAATLDRATNSFEVVAREWFARQSPGWAKSHADKVIQRLEKDIFPWLGNWPIHEIAAPELLTVIRRIEDRGAKDTAHRAMQNCGQVFRYAVATGRAERDPSADLRGALPPLRHENFASITEPAKVAELLCAIDGFRGTFVVKSALLLAPLLFVRPGELRKAEWSGFDLERQNGVIS